MIIDLKELRRQNEPLLVEADFNERALHLRSDISLLNRPVQTRMTVSLTGERLRVTGSLRASLELICARCLAPFPQHLEKRFQLEYWPDPVPAREGEERALSYQDLAIGFYRNDELDLRGVVCEQIVLEIPMKPVCREACKGLCDQCGANLNEGECQCERNVLDPRMAALWELKKRMGN